MPRPYRPWLWADEERVIELRFGGWSYSFIAATTGRTWQSVKAKLRELAVYHPGGYRRRDRKGRFA